MSFGGRLQREREMRGITLDEIAEATKIGTRSLRALEEEDFKKLPGGIFNKGFVRAYAHYLGIDEEQAVADYMTTVGEQDEREAPMNSEGLRKLEANWKPPKHERQSDPIQVPWGALLLLLVIAGAIFGGWHYRHRLAEKYQAFKARRHPQVQQQITTAQQAAPAYQAPATSPSPLPTAPANETAAAPAQATNTTAASGAAPAVTSAAPEVQNAQDFVVLVRARQDSWVDIIADGKHVVKDTLRAPREEAIHAKKSVTLVAGNAPGLEVSFNGKPQVLAGAGQKRYQVTFTPEGMQMSGTIER